MPGQIRLLTAVQLCNLFGINEFRYTHDSKKKHRWIGMTLLYILLIIILIGYIIAFCAGMAHIGLVEIVPQYLFVICSIVVLFFSIFRAANVIFQASTFEELISLPLSKYAIVISRFLTMYITDLVLCFLVMLPGIVLLGIYRHPGVQFYILGIIETALLPLLPITVATAAGAGIAALSSHMKHKNLVNSALSIIFAVGIIFISTMSGGSIEKLSGEIIKNYALAISSRLQRIYPPSAWFQNSVVNGQFSGFLLYVGVSAVLFTLTVYIVQRCFSGISASLNSVYSGKRRKLRELRTASPMKALLMREFKRYFASSIYMTNTAIGYIMMVIIPIALLFEGTEKLEKMLSLPGIVSKALPFLLAWTASIMPSTSCSISLEGKQWWIAKTLPVKSRDILGSKILLNLAIALPFYVISVVLSIIAVKPGVSDALWLIIIPAVYIVFSAVAGITINLAFPLMKWENETRVVKQSASAFLSMLAGFIAILPPVIVIFAVKSIPSELVMLFTTVCLLVITVLLYAKSSRKSLMYIE